VTVAAHRIAKNGHVRVTVIGYTDPGGTAGQDKKLSADRANSVADALAGNGVDRNIIDVKFVGSAGYVADSVEGRRAIIAVNNQ
jgi:outer membrane protein OmpA-like peptidoglycan-associated protein